MSPLNKGPMMAPRNPAGMRGPPMPPRYGRVPPMPPPPGMGRPMPPPPMNPMFGHPRGRPLPPGPPRPGPMMGRPNGPPVPPPMFRRGPMPPMPPMPPMGPMRGPMGPRVPPMMRPGHRGMLPPHALPHMRPRFPPNHVNGKKMNNKKNNKLDELELKKPWMTDEIRTEIQKKNKLYAKAKKNKDAKEWEEFKDLRNKVTRMIRDAKNEYLAKNPDQAHLYRDDEFVEFDDNDEPRIVDSEDDEEDEEVPLYCEVCDRDFRTEELLQQHINEHQTCKIDGCTFTAHPKIVDKHIGMQHSTGLYQRMKSVMSDGDIEKWKAERKRRYPTAANAKLQEEERQEKRQRGEVVKSQADKKTRPTKREIRKNRKRTRNRHFQVALPEQEPIARELYRGILPFAGTGMLDAEEESHNALVEKTLEEREEEEEEAVLEQPTFEVSDEEEPIRATTVETPPANPVVPARLMSLVADYGSESDNDEPPEEVPIKRMKVEEEASQVKSNEVTNGVQSQVPAKENAKASIVSNESTKQRDMRQTSQGSKNLEKRPSRRQNSSQYSNGRLRLLNRLLSRSIQHERNAIFQCITFIEKNNFFD